VTAKPVLHIVSATQPAAAFVNSSGASPTVAYTVDNVTLLVTEGALALVEQSALDV
jgi:hypothetical protein